MRHRVPALALVLGLLMGLGAKPASAQMGERWRERQTRREAAQKARENGAGERPNANGGAGQHGARNMEGLPPKWVENLRDMPPEDQERFMQNNERFKSLPPQRQEQIRQNLQRWNSLTPEQQDVLKLMRGIVESYRTISISNAHALKRLAHDYFKVDLDVEPVIAAVRSRRGDLISAEIRRLQSVIRELEEQGR